MHIAVVDLELPHRANAMGGTRPISRTEEGLRVLQLLRRLEPTPPTIVVRPPQASTPEHVRGLSTALREGAFAVLDRPLQLESMLEVLRRILKRHYQDVLAEHVLTPTSGTAGPEEQRTMNVKPLGDKIIIKRAEAQGQTDSGIFLPESAKDTPKEGEIVATGKGILNKNNGEYMPFTVKTGDRVIFVLRRD